MNDRPKLEGITSFDMPGDRCNPEYLQDHEFLQGPKVWQRTKTCRIAMTPKIDTDKLRFTMCSNRLSELARHNAIPG